MHIECIAQKNGFRFNMPSQINQHTYGEILVYEMQQDSRVDFASHMSEAPRGKWWILLGTTNNRDDALDIMRCAASIAREKVVKIIEDL